MDNSPYETPQTPQFIPPAARPPVIMWYQIYCALMTLVYVACLAFGIFLAMDGLVELGDDVDAQAMKFQGIAMVVIGVPLMFLSALHLSYRAFRGPGFTAS